MGLPGLLHGLRRAPVRAPVEDSELRRTQGGGSVGVRAGAGPGPPRSRPSGGAALEATEPGTNSCRSFKRRSPEVSRRLYEGRKPQRDKKGASKVSVILTQAKVGYHGFHLANSFTFCSYLLSHYLKTKYWPGPGYIIGGHRGTIHDYPGFSPSVDAEAIRKAIRGIGTEEKTLISILTERTNAQRQLIVQEYQAAYGKELKDDLKGDLSGHFKQLMVALVTPPAVFDAKQLKKSMKGVGTSEQALIEVLTTRTSRQMKEIAQAYYTVYKKSLGDDISSETSGDFRKALLTLADGRRDESLKVDEHLAKKDAQILYNAGENRWGTDEDKFTEILCLRSYPHLKLTFDEYRNISQKDIEDSIKGELSGHFEDLLLAIVHCARNMPAFLAARLHQALKGAGTDEFTLNRIMVSRSEIDLLDIRAEFKKHYGYSLYSAIKSDTSGDYELTLLKICGGDD